MLCRTHRCESFDEWTLGKIQIQFFEPRLWRLGWRLRMTKHDRVLALPMLAIRWQ